MKILHIITGLENAGAEAVLYRLVSRDEGKTVHEVISLMGIGFYGESLRQGGVRVHALHLPRGRMTLAALFRMFRLLRSTNPDVVQTWMPHADLVGGVIARLSGTKSVFWGVHGSNLDPSKTLRKTLLVARLCAWLSWIIPTRIICCSEMAADVHRAMGYSGSKLRIVHNGADVHEFRPDAKAREEVRNEWGIGRTDVLLGMVARWDPHKDHRTLLAAMQHVRAHTSAPLQIVLVGPGMTQANEELTSMIRQHHLPDIVRLAGSRADIPAVMNALDIHVLSSSGEAFGNVSIEAMSCGIPAVVTSVGAGRLIVGETGWVVRPSDPIALGNAILQAMSAMASVDEWELRKAACRVRVIEEFSLERMIAAYHREWESLQVSTDTSCH